MNTPEVTIVFSAQAESRTLAERLEQMLTNLHPETKEEPL